MSSSQKQLQQPTLTTDRLVLEPLRPEHAEELYQLAGDSSIADTMISIPHPLERTTVEQWIRQAPKDFAKNRAATFAVVRREDKAFIGCMALREIDLEHEVAELSFWMGRPFAGRGYATEAGQLLLRYAFTQRQDLINRIYAYHMVRNPASGSVCGKLGMEKEGLLRQRVKKHGVYEDVVLRAVMRSDFLKQIEEPQEK